jgi:hypothetical protein
MRLKRGSRAAASMNLLKPVEKLSTPTTSLPPASSRSTRLLPMNPAAPVTNARRTRRSVL